MIEMLLSMYMYSIDYIIIIIIINCVCRIGV